MTGGPDPTNDRPFSRGPPRICERRSSAPVSWIQISSRTSSMCNTTITDRLMQKEKVPAPDCRSGAVVKWQLRPGAERDSAEVRVECIHKTEGYISQTNIPLRDDRELKE